LARYRELKKGNVTAFVDGDYTDKLVQLKHAFLKQVPEPLQGHAQAWIDCRIDALTGSGLAPETFVIQRALSSPEIGELASQLNTQPGKLRDYLEAVLTVDPHEAFYRLATCLCCDVSVLWYARTSLAVTPPSSSPYCRLSEAILTHRFLENHVRSGAILM
jgi:hypothetical protein